MWRETDRLLGAERAKEFWSLYESVRNELGYVDFLVTLARFHERHADTPLALDRAILDLPYERFRYPSSLEVIDALWRVGVPVVLSDGDPAFQPLKVSRAGIAAAVRGNVLVFAHKDQHLDDIARLFPADRYVAVDDKAEVLARIKSRWGERVSTVHVLQGKYADDAFEGPRPDVVIGAIGELSTLLGTRDALRVFFEGASIGPGG
ncbi:MAG TPA: hypothetical protein VEU77_08045 [Candidatus Acidoferrales bacterium]|nr:hypothetical protein [Candidatus Acidoferrales bacterium]